MSAPERIRRGVATKLGLTLAEYDARLAAGEKWCYEGQAWHPSAEFNPTGHCPVHPRLAREVPRCRLFRGSQEWNDRLARVLVK